MHAFFFVFFFFVFLERERKRSGTSNRDEIIPSFFFSMARDLISFAVGLFALDPAGLRNR